jgi:hypothetical protein
MWTGWRLLSRDLVGAISPKKGSLFKINEFRNFRTAEISQRRPLRGNVMAVPCNHVRAQ